eukprot:9422244-Alexandrium_andersonii.AAC.1
MERSQPSRACPGGRAPELDAMSASSLATPRSEAPSRAHLRHHARVAERRSAWPHRATAGARGTAVP